MATVKGKIIQKDFLLHNFPIENSDTQATATWEDGIQAPLAAPPRMARPIFFGDPWPLVPT